MESFQNGSERRSNTGLGERSISNRDVARHENGQNGSDERHSKTWQLETKKLIEILVGRPATIAALEHLASAKDTAIQCGQLPESFGVDISELQHCGLAGYELKILNDQNLVRKCHVQSINGSNGVAAVNPGQTLNWGYVITSFGERVLKYLLTFSQETGAASARPSRPTRLSDHAAHKNSNNVPHYNSKTRTLTINGKVARKFRWAASNQEKILMAFQEEGWPTRIDDPLPSDSEICPKRRLHDTIKCLNHGQRCKGTWFVRFRGDGTGQGVLWEFNDDSKAPVDEQDKR